METLYGINEKFIQKEKAKIQAILDELNLDTNITVSNGLAGVSMYLHCGLTKIRISDHSVFNFDRLMNEVHFSFGYNENSLRNTIEMVFFPERFETVKYFETGFQWSGEMFYNAEQLSALIERNGSDNVKVIREHTNKAGELKYVACYYHPFKREMYKKIRK